MRIQPDDLSSGFYIKHYDENQIIVVNKIYTSPFILGVDSIIDPWVIEDNHIINQTFIDTIKKQAPQVVLLGTGLKQVFPGPDKLKQLIALQISLEIMDTGSACRTYNIIQAEGRTIIAGLII